MKVYHFISQKYGLNSIRDQCLKVSFINDLNDPFELLAVDFNNSKTRKLFLKFKERVSSKVGLLCFSKKWECPLLWSHYADRHRGVALEFEINENELIDVDYQLNRLKVNISKLNSIHDDLFFDLLSTKYKDWSYEDEIRMFLNSNQFYKSGKHHFTNFGNTIKLRSVIAGPLSKLNKNDILKVLPYNQKIRFVRSHLAFQSFRVVHNPKEKIITLKKTNNV